MCRCLFFMFLHPYFINLDSSDKVIRTVASLQDFIAEHAGGRASNGLERILDLTCLGIVDTPRSSIFCRYRRCVYERSRNFTPEKAV